MDALLEAITTELTSLIMAEAETQASTSNEWLDLQHFTSSALTTMVNRHKHHITNWATPMNTPPTTEAWLDDDMTMPFSQSGSMLDSQTNGAQQPPRLNVVPLQPSHKTGARNRGSSRGKTQSTNKGNTNFANINIGHVSSRSTKLSTIANSNRGGTAAQRPRTTSPPRKKLYEDQMAEDKTALQAFDGLSVRGNVAHTIRSDKSPNPRHAKHQLADPRVRSTASRSSLVRAAAMLAGLDLSQPLASDQAQEAMPQKSNNRPSMVRPLTHVSNVVVEEKPNQLGTLCKGSQNVKCNHKSEAEIQKLVQEDDISKDAKAMQGRTWKSAPARAAIKEVPPTPVAATTGLCSYPLHTITVGDLVGGIITHTSWLGACVNIGAEIEGFVDQATLANLEFEIGSLIHGLRVEVVDVPGSQLLLDGTKARIMTLLPP